jgi:hypothetical protein
MIPTFHCLIFKSGHILCYGVDSATGMNFVSIFEAFGFI